MHATSSNDGLSRASTNEPKPSSFVTYRKDIQQLDQDIARYFKAARDAIQRRNGLLPISKLPTELLCTIFGFVRGDVVALVPCEYNHLDEIRGKMKWANVSHVCQRWRNAALSEPALWTMPPLCCPKWTSVMLERSRMSSLSIYLNSNAVKEEIAFTVLRHMPHIGDLTIAEAGPQDLKNYFDILVGTPAPALEYIHILTPGDLILRRPSLVDSENFVIPPNTLLNTHQLRHLKLTCVDIHWDSHLLASLTTLELENISRARRPNVTQLRCMLERMPRLKYLTLFNCLPEIGLDAEGPPILLSYLDTLEVTATAAQLTLLSKLITPAEDIRLVKTRVLHLDGFDVQPYLSAMTNPFPASNIRTVSIANCRTSDTWGFTLSPINEADYNITASETTPIGLFITLSNYLLDGSNQPTSDRRKQTFRQLYASIRWSDLRVLDMTGLHWRYRSRYIVHHSLVYDMAETFGALPSIHTVVIADTSERLLVTLLEEGPHLLRDRGSTVTDSDYFVLKGLRHIILRNVCFFKERGDAEGGFELEDFRECLRNRRDCGLPLESLRLEDCSRLLPVDINSLRDIVAHVEWDGKGIEPGMEVYL